MSETIQFSKETLASLVEASAAINAGNDLDDTLQAIANAAAAVMKAEASSVIMLDRARGKQVFRATVGDRADQLRGQEYDEGVGISGVVLRTGEAAVVNDVSRENAHYKGIDISVGFQTRSLIAAPLIHKKQKLGVVEVINPVQRDRFNEHDCQLARVFANLAAIAVANGQLRDRLRRDNRGLQETLKRTGVEMVGQSPAARKVEDLIRRVAPSSSTVLLLGETGVGKELAARRIHNASPRADRPFIAVNCAALPSTLLESELFGHEAGSFTGATGRKLGRFELAGGGTIFLDEIAEVIPDVQVKLLRVLEEKEFFRVGGVAPLTCDARVIAATNRDLQAETRAGRFRDDLYYRLNVFPITVPPLRDRREDIGLLVEHFLRRLASEMKIPVPRISDPALAALAAYSFPGNIRELQNILERACLLCCPPSEQAAAGTIDLAHLPPDVGGAAGAPPAPSSLAAGERAILANALRRCGGNQTQAARALGISRDQLRYRMKKHGLSRRKD